MGTPAQDPTPDSAGGGSPPQPPVVPPKGTNHSKLAAIFAALAALLSALAVTVTITSNPTDHTHTTVIRVGKAAPVVQPVAPAVTANVPAGDLVPQTVGGKVVPLADSTPPNVPQAALTAGQQFNDTTAQQQLLPPQAPAGAQSVYCRQDFSAHAYSDRTVPKPTEWVNHITVSTNVPGWGDVYSILHYLPKVTASATFIMDFEGHCMQMVPLDKKPWTQLGANSTSISVEIIANGHEPRSLWLSSPIFKKHILANLARDVMKQYGMPLRFVDPVGCTFQPGWTDHYHLECGNNHVDVTPTCARTVLSDPTRTFHPFQPLTCTGFPYDAFQKQLTAFDKATQLPLLRYQHTRIHLRLAKLKCTTTKGRKAHAHSCAAAYSKNKSLHAAIKRASR